MLSNISTWLELRFGGPPTWPLRFREDGSIPGVYWGGDTDSEFRPVVPFTALRWPG